MSLSGEQLRTELALAGKSPAQTWYVSSVIGNNGFSGKDNKHPFATLVKAHSVASAKDTIVLLDGHAESITSSTAMTISKACHIVSYSKGELRPVFTLSSAATARINVTASGVVFENCVFIANYADIATCFLNNAGENMQILDCEFRDTTTILNFLAIVTTTASVSANGLVFKGNKVIMVGTTAATTPIKILADTSLVTISDNYVFKAVLDNTSCLLAHGAFVISYLDMARNRVVSENVDSATGAFLITTSATTNSGMVYDNYVQGLDVAAALLVTAGSNYGMMNNLYCGDADASGFVLPAIGSD